jgi:hypothetical protein
MRTSERGERLLRAAREYAEHLPAHANTFASSPSFLRREPWEARTLCSTFVTALLKEVEGWTLGEIGRTFGRHSPYARDYHAAVARTGSGVFDQVLHLSGVEPGCLLTIAFAELLDGFTGHTAIIASLPKPYTEGRWQVDVVDSTGSPHGSTDSRSMRNHLGVGQGTMVLRVDGEGFIQGYQWSPSAESHFNADGARDLRIGRWR